MRRILLTGCGGFATIGFIRCLKLANEKFYLIGTDSNPHNIFFSLTDKTYLIPPADSPYYIDSLNRIIKKEKVELIWSQPQPEVEVISKNREKILTKVFLPRKKTVDICQNKVETARILEKSGIPIPDYFLIQKKSDLTKAFERFGKKIWLRNITGAGGKGAFLANNLKECVFWIDFNKGWRNFSASEYLPGRGFGCDMLFYDGKLVFSQLKERLAYFMSKANIVGVTGTTGVLKTVADRKLSKLCEEAVYAIDPIPHGAFDVDIKCDTNGEPKVTEINAGRFLSSSVSLFYKTKFLAPFYAIKLGLGDQISIGFKKRNPIPKDIIISRQLDIEPQKFSVLELEKIVNNQKRNLISKVTRYS